MRNEDLRADILADIKAGKIVSPKRIKQLIKENKARAAGFARFLDNESCAREAAEKMAEINKETEVLRDMLAASDEVIDVLTAAVTKDGALSEDSKALKDMKLEWEAYTAGAEHYTRHIKPSVVDVLFPAGEGGAVHVWQ
jgi:hypothetical protein